jgi:hypothetical protein
MKKLVFVVIILLIGFSIYWFKFRNADVPRGPKTPPLKTTRHSLAFNNNLDTLMGAYLNLKSALVEADSIEAKKAATKFLVLADSLKLDELKKDTAVIFETANSFLNDVKSMAGSLVKQANLTGMRQDFSSISENIYPLLKTIHYEGKTLYWQNCPMAFGEGKEANWISNTDEIINPYMGKKNPEFKATMVHCGETKDSIKAL